MARPEISSITCIERCAGALLTTSTGQVKVGYTGVIRISGRYLKEAAAITFMGGPGPQDDIDTTPRAATPTELEVVIPKRVQTGPMRIHGQFRARMSTATTVSIRIIKNDSTLYDPGAGPTIVDGSMIQPITGPITGIFGEWRGDHAHSGLDLAAPTGTTIRAAMSGQVVWAGWYGGYGNFTCVHHRAYRGGRSVEDVTTCYAHQSAYLVESGATVSQGQPIGRVGNTGHSFGAHLHFEVRLGIGTSGTPVNPLKYLPARAKSTAQGAATSPLD